MNNLFKRLIVTNAFTAALLLASNAQAMDDNAYLLEGTNFANQIEKIATSQDVPQTFEIDNKMSKESLSFARTLLQNSADSFGQKNNSSAYNYVVLVMKQITAILKQYPESDTESDEDDGSDSDLD